MKNEHTQMLTTIITTSIVISIVSFITTADVWWSQSGDPESTKNTMNPVADSARHISPINERKYVVSYYRGILRYI